MDIVHMVMWVSTLLVAMRLQMGQAYISSFFSWQSYLKFGVHA